jgi:anaerobic selenocysteine-containing dehydrogenase
MTETAAMADIVLPATTFLEHDDLYTAGAHTFLQMHRAVVPPYAECRSNHEVQCALAERLGAEHRGFKMTAFEIIAETLRASGLPGPEEFIEGTWLDCAQPFETAHFLDGFGHLDKKFHFRANWRSMAGPLGGDAYRSLPEFPDHVANIDDGDPARPFRMVAAPSRSFLNTSFNNTPSGIAREGRPSALVHPEALTSSASPMASASASATTRAASWSVPAPLTGCSPASSSSKASGPTRLSKKASASIF